jgi:hypothetical protein
MHDPGAPGETQSKDCHEKHEKPQKNGKETMMNRVLWGWRIDLPVFVAFCVFLWRSYSQASISARRGVRNGA